MIVRLNVRSLGFPLLLIIMLLAAMACAGSPKETAPLTTNPSPTKTPLPTGRGTAPPTNIPTPTETPLPTPRETAPPTKTPLPTNITPSTQTPATTPGPITYSQQVDGYMAVAPEVLRSGQTHNIPVSLLRGAEPAEGKVRLELSEPGSGRVVARAERFVQGSGSVPLAVPPEADGFYTLRVSGEGTSGGSFDDSARVQVQAAPVILFVETDKPIYKPGQELRIRALRMNTDLKPIPGPVTVEIQDAKGIKVYKRVVVADEFGMASASLPLSSEPNLGVWKLTALSAGQTAQLDVRVEEYALPKYEITLDMPQDWILVDAAVIGTVSAEYSFGKPVRGELEIVASRYVGQWEEYATFTKEIDGETSFELPAPRYVAGSPAAGGQGNLQLNVTVREQGTGYVEQTSRLITVAASPVNLQLIPAGSYFSPGLPFSMLLVAETPGNQPIDADAMLSVSYFGENLEQIAGESLDAEVTGGKALVELSPPSEAVAMTGTARATGGAAQLALQASYSPSGSFIHVEQTGEPLLEVGGQAAFRVHSTSEARNFYYEVLSRGRVIFSGMARTPDIAFTLTPDMAPSARLVVYQILPNNEVAADYLPFRVTAGYPMQISAAFSVDQARPGDSVVILVNTEGVAKVGLAAVDRSVFILAENRLNLQQVFAELERLYTAPRAEAHLEYLPDLVVTRGAADTFREAGLIILSNREAPAGAEFRRPMPTATPEPMMEMEERVAMEAPAAAEEEKTVESILPVDSGLAEVERVRQFFPETWLWADVMTDESGTAVLSATAPDSITTWSLRAVGMSPEHGFGVANTELVVFQPFFLQVDLPYSAVRGEEFPVKVALYNYLDTEQEFVVDLEESADFALLGDGVKRVSVAPGEVGGVEFDIRLTTLGSLPIKVTARSRESADAVIETLLVEPEGAARESVANTILSADDRLDFPIAAPPGAIAGSSRAYVALTGSYLAQTLDGLENLLQMPFGCGEQNMILFAPNIYVARYLEATGQSKPEISAKAEFLMTTGYQRELTYRRDDGSFSAFGQSDPSGSLWLTAFVLKSFAQADGLIYVDETVLREAGDWIRRHQRSDGSFEPVGFLHHRELLGGLQGNTALTGYVAIALLEAGDRDASARALSYLETQLEDITDAYTMAITAYALALGGSPRASNAHERLMSMGVADGDTLSWDGAAAVETTGYAVLALLEHGDGINAGRAARWLVEQRNAFGGYGSTQDTVVGLQALIGFAANARFDVDMTVELTAGEWSRQVSVNAANADVVQIVELPAAESVRIWATGSGQVVAQVVHRYNMPEVERAAVDMFRIKVDYGAEHVAVDDLIDITASLTFTPPVGLNVEAGMVVLDVAVPTGFAPVDESVRAVVADLEQVKRRETAGRKVIFYIEDLAPGEPLRLQFQARAQYPVRAQAVTSQVYSYYTPDWRAETLAGDVVVAEE